MIAMFQIPPAGDVGPSQPQVLEVTLKKSFLENLGMVFWGIVKLLLLLIIVLPIVGVIIAGIKNEESGDSFANEESWYDKTPIDGYYRSVAYDENAKHIAVISVAGTITGEDMDPSFSSGLIVAPNLIAMLANAADDSDIDAILLRVDSPGGEVGASERIADMIEEINTTRIPVYVIMENMAASGGYYISTPAKKIYAYPETLLGNIGVRMDVPNVEGLMEKIGVRMESIESGEYKTIGSPFRPMKDEERQIFQDLVSESYDQFLTRVSEGRGLPKETVKTLADGRIYSGTQGEENKLIDKTVPSLNALIGELRTEMGTSVQLIQYDYPLSPWDEFLMTVSTTISPLQSRFSDIIGAQMKYQ